MHTSSRWTSAQSKKRWSRTLRSHLERDVVEDAGDTSGRSDVVSDSFEEDLWDYDFSLSASEIASSTKCISLMESAIAFLKVVAKAVGVSSKTDAGSPGAEAAVDVGCVAVTQFGIALNELGVSLCPPQDTPNIHMSVDGFVQCKWVEWCWAIYLLGGTGTELRK